MDTDSTAHEPKAAMRRLPKPVVDETPDGEKIAVRFTRTGAVLKLADGTDTVISSVVVSGVDHSNSAIAKQGFWGRLWNGIKKIIGAFKGLFVDGVDVGGTCRVKVKVGMNGLRPEKVGLELVC